MIELNPGVKVSDLDMSLLPLFNFHIVVVVEPDPESWALPNNDKERFSQLLEMRSELIVDDIFQNDTEPGVITAPAAGDVSETLIITVGEGQGFYYFTPMLEYSSYTASLNDFDFDKLRVLLDGIIKNFPLWKRVAVVGGVYEDEIIRVANTVQKAGFDTTIITRHCISNDVFDNLDEIWDAIDAAKREMPDYFDELDNE